MAVKIVRRAVVTLLLTSASVTLAAHTVTAQGLVLVTAKAPPRDRESAGALRGARVAVSANGRYVAFCSAAAPNDLVPNRYPPPGSSGTSNVYVRDIVSGTTEILTLDAVNPSVTSNGTCAADVQITPDGRYVAFKSTATNFQTNQWSYEAGTPSGWVHDRQTGALTLVDVAVQPFHAAGVKDMVMSENGRFVAFSSAGAGYERQLIPNFIDANGALVDLYVRDLQAGITRLVSRHYFEPLRGSPSGVETTTSEHTRVFTANGRKLLFAGAFSQLMANGTSLRNLYVYDWDADTVTLVSARTSQTLPGSGVTVDAGTPADFSFSVSADGAYAAFTASTTQEELTPDVTSGRKNVYVRDLRTLSAATTLISHRVAGIGGNGNSTTPIVSRSGSLVVFESVATDLVDSFTDSGTFTDIFAAPITGSGPVEWLTREPTLPLPGNQGASIEDVSADGRFVAWRSTATNFVEPWVVSDQNQADDVFVRDRAAGTVSVKSVLQVGAAPATGNAASGRSSLLPGGAAAFFSDATNLLEFMQITGTNIYAPSQGSADLSLSMTDAPDPAIAGQQVTYTITVANSGPSAAFGVVLTVPVPAGASSLIGQGGVLPIGGVLTFDLGALSAGSTVTRTVVAIYAAPRQASVTATVTTSQVDPAPGNNSVSQTTTIIADPSRPSIAGTVRDTGGAPLPGVTVTLAGSASHTTITGAGGTYLLGNLPADGSFTVTPSATGYAFTPASASFANVTTDQTADFTAACAPAISGLVRDRLDGALAGVTVTLSGAAGATTVTDVDGRYTFGGLALGQSFTVTPSRPGFTFQPASATITTFTCGTTPQTFVATTGSFTRYFAEGATSGFFDTTIALLNASGVPSTVRLTFQTATGANIVRDYPLGAYERETVDPKTIPGLETAEFSTVVSSDQPVIADRTMHWDGSGYGSHAETSVAGPLTSWYLAEGATTAGFQLFYLIQNPNDTATNVQVTYLLPAPAQPLTKTYTVAPRARQNIWVNLEDARLAQAEVSAVFASSLPVIVERAMYRDAWGQFFGAGHEAAAVPGPASQWFFAEGNTGPFFDLFYLIANPGTTEALIDGRFLLPDGSVLTKRYAVAPQSRFNVWADYETFPGRADLPLADTAVSATFTSANGVAFVAERAMWWPTNYLLWFEGHDSAGALRSGTKWGLADGEVGGSRGTETYLLIANTSNADGSVRVTFVYEDGTTSAITRDVRANSRTNVSVRDEVPATANRRFGTIVESLGVNPVQIVVERAMYNSVPGVTWAAGSDNLGTRLR